MTDQEKIRVLVVDDNDRYREAFCRNLFIQGMLASEAHHADHALELLKSDPPDVMVTDLQMRNQTEGLELIRDARAIEPILPVIMISAVGTFDEGARASQLGAAHVFSKARLEEEMETLHDCIRKSHEEHKRSRELLDLIAKFRPSTEGPAPNAQARIQKLLEITTDEGTDPYVRQEAFDVMTILSDGLRREGEDSETAEAVASAGGQPDQVGREAFANYLRKEIEAFDQLDEETRDSLLMGEFLYDQKETIGSELEMSRTTCFAYCFSVENQAKLHLRKNLQKFLSDPDSIKLITSLQEKKSDQVNMFFQQHLLQLIRGRQIDFTIDNVRQTFLRIKEHQSKYRPDGLKALGIMILTFGREYEFKQFNENVRVENPLGIKGLETEDEILEFAQMLINLQHLRNPYIHPEISGRAGIEPIRKTAFRCLNLMMRIV